jgi:hypothetical protein
MIGNAVTHLARWAHPIICTADLYLLNVLACLNKARHDWNITRDLGIKLYLVGYWKFCNVLEYAYAAGTWNLFIWILIGLCTSVTFRTT